MRFYVAPQLGYALLLCEYCSPQGEYLERRWAKDFRRYAQGIYIPHRLGCESYRDGELFFACYYEIEELDHVNEVIDERAFILELPKGAEIVDGRAQTHSTVFHLGVTPPGPESADLEDVIRNLPPPHGQGYLHGLAVLLGVALALAFALSLWLVYRRRKRA